uniref:Uncharacterized protein n=1 Tax=Nelumbo nucifera TaxID=4432 RepID=A0A822XLV6_NELNU|nr:TPA_asm: hypothetical protein HUJ06_021389 [Nelumbo nucifera]
MVVGVIRRRGSNMFSARQGFLQAKISVLSNAKLEYIFGAHEVTKSQHDGGCQTKRMKATGSY